MRYIISINEMTGEREILEHGLVSSATLTVNVGFIDRPQVSPRSREQIEHVTDNGTS
jgi:hypothetical protein